MPICSGRLRRTDQRSHRVDQLATSKRLGQHAARARRQRTLLRIAVAAAKVSGHSEHRQLRVVTTQRLQCPHSVAPGHVHVGHDQGCRLCSAGPRYPLPHRPLAAAHIRRRLAIRSPARASAGRRRSPRHPSLLLRARAMDRAIAESARALNPDPSIRRYRKHKAGEVINRSWPEPSSASPASSSTLAGRRTRPGPAKA